MSKKWSIVMEATVALFTATGIFPGYEAFAAKLYPFTGTVTKVTPEIIQLRSGTNTVEFAREEGGPADFNGLKAGDQVTVWYSREAKKLEVEPMEKRGNEPGQAEPSQSSPLIIQDDRAFYNANNESHAKKSGDGDFLKKNS